MSRVDRLVTLIRATVTAVLVTAIGASGCAQRRSDPQSSWIDRQARAHIELDAALKRGDLELAEKTLLTALAERAPVGLAPDVVALLRKDQLFRLADILLEKGEPQRALDAAMRGLEIDHGPDLFTANLLVARGQALEALAREREAATAYFDALRINDLLLQEVLQDD